MNDFIKKMMETEYYNNFELDINSFNILKQLKKEMHLNLTNIQERNLVIKKVSEKVIIEKNQKYFHETIIDDINENQDGAINFIYNHNGYKFNFLFYKLKNNKVSENKIKNYVKIMISWLITCKNYETDNCVKELDITIYLSGIKKELPTDNRILIGSKHVNTAYTYRCVKHDSSITLYRQEDLLKVFFHETFHTFNFDFKNNCKKKLQNDFPIDSELNLFESYCETWARIINHLYYSIIIGDDDDMKIFTATIALESLFSFSQCIKILNHMNLTINDLSNSEKIRTNFKETSNVFSYFVVTSYIMMNISEFIGFCSRKNYNILKFKEESVDDYIILIKKFITNMESYSFKNKLIDQIKQKTKTTKMIILNVDHLL